MYDRINPGAVAWFTVSATQLVDRLSGCLAILDAHGVAWQKLESDDPGRIVHEDQDQVVVVPHGTRYVRFQAALPDRQGRFLGVFALVNMMARRDQLTPAQHLFRRLNNDWYDANFTNPAAVDPTVYASPGAAAWFRHTSPHLISRVAGYLAILDAHGVAWQRLDSDDPGRIVYEDQDQVVVVPHDECIKLD
ncbi:hypothetical protein [Lentzea nigeriaca]|uniref:hypothetical protein n=1 Tax=Lentzea nigeriaca TaxID=1128665 RepID=UPI001EF860B1|nr:hypothetical protein [Lentzea nigeriaca]MBM7861463.1 hypothetical protein [Lentzea nigeriaca]